MKRSCLLVLLLLLTGGARVFGQQPERLDAEWILRYEQSWGAAGLYVEEPELNEKSTEAARVRADLIKLTIAGRQFADAHPGDVPTPERLLAEGLLHAPIAPPEKVQYAYVPRTRRFVSSRGGEQDIVAGAMKQLEAAENYRRRVVNGAPGLYRAWEELLKQPNVPELIQREIETRRFAIRMRESGPMKAARQTQEQLGRLNDAIELAIAMGKFEKGQSITMQDVQATGFIDLLEALPLGGKYEVTQAGVPPAALIGGARVPYDKMYVAKRLEGEVRKALVEKPDYPPALAMLAQSQSGEEALATLNRAIELWPDVPALRIQRIAIDARLQHVDKIAGDMEYLLRRFPAAPVCLEIDAATRKEALTQPGVFRSTLASALAEVRPEVLNLQVLAFKELLDAGDQEGAAKIRDRMIAQHPGYEPLLPDPFEKRAEGEGRRAEEKKTGS